jgi:TonB family protein
MIRGATGSGNGSTGGGVKGLRVETRGLNLGMYKERLERRIKSNWQMAKSDYANLQRNGRTVVVYFDWHRDGRLVFAGIGSSTGDPILDRDARNAVLNTSPFDPIPATITLDVIRLGATFTY